MIGARVSNEKRALARAMRRAPTPSEAAAWELLRDRRCCGMKFRRQQVIRGFVVDFYCDALRLAVEIDGPIHDGQEQYDLARDLVIAQAGVRTLRIRSDEVSAKHLTALITPLLHAAAAPLPLSAPESGPGG